MGVVRSVEFVTAINVSAERTEFPFKTLPDLHSTVPKISGFLVMRESANGSREVRRCTYKTSRRAAT